MLDISKVSMKFQIDTLPTHPKLQESREQYASENLAALPLIKFIVKYADSLLQNCNLVLKHNIKFENMITYRNIQNEIHVTMVSR